MRACLLHVDGRPIAWCRAWGVALRFEGESSFPRKKAPILLRTLVKKVMNAMQVHTVLELELGSSMGLLLRLAAHEERLAAIRGKDQLALPISSSESFFDVLGNPVSRLTLGAGVHQIEIGRAHV